MIKIENSKLSIEGDKIDLLAELATIMNQFITKGIANKEELLHSVDLATASDGELVDMIIEALRSLRRE